jgi:hypothetical protein
MKKELWYLAAIRVNKAARGFTVPWDKCKNKWTSDIKEKWKHWVMLSEMSGFGWHDEKELYEADNDVWQRLNKAHPRVIWHKTHVMYHREELSEILHDTQATGAGAISLNVSTFQTDNDLLVLDPRLIRIDTDQRTSARSSASSSPVPQSKPKPSYERSKRRLKIDISDDDDVGAPVTKKANKKGEEKVDLRSAISGLSTTMERAIKAKEAHKTNSQKAVQLLESAYGNRMDLMEFINASTFFEDERKAGNFLVITDL